MESNKQEKSNLLNNNPIADRAGRSWISKHSSAAGSPLYQRPNPDNAEALSAGPTGASIYSYPATQNYAEGFHVVQPLTEDSKPLFTKKQLANRIDERSGEPLDYNLTSGNVVTTGGTGNYQPKPYKVVNMEGTTPTNQSGSEVLELNTMNINQPTVTNKEFDTNTWSSSARKDYPNQTKTTSPQGLYNQSSERFDNARINDSIRTVNNRNLASTEQKLNAEGKKLSNRYTKEQLLNFMGRQ
tara:strand:- start:49 stop:774 length:726 start_codon:yes stop_codon:yes gene_type:complete